MKYDVAVIGAGPAGAFAAQRLASLGCRTILIDPCEHTKVCAGILTAQYAREYQIHEAYIERKLKGVRISFQDIHAEINYAHAAEFSIDRQVFDRFNLNEALMAGSELRKEKAVSLLETGRRVEITTTNDVVIHAHYAVLSSGVSDLARQLGSVQLYAYCVQQRKDTAPGDYFVMDLKKDGYSWTAPKKDHVLTGTSSLVDYPDIPGEKALIPVGGPVERTYTDRLLLAGDAAGFVSPFEGEGIYYARRSGEIAAEVLAGVLSGDNRTADYEMRWKKEFDFSTLEMISILLSDEKRLEWFVRQVRDNEKFNKFIEDVLIKGGQSSAIKNVGF